MSASAAPPPQTSDDETKDKLYNRLDYAVGAETRRAYGKMNVLLVGLSGLGLEIVKNLSLTGVGSVTILDDAPISYDDLSTLFYAGQADLGKPRASTLASRLTPLNRFCNIDVVSGPVTEDLIKRFHVAVFVNGLTTQLTQENAWARKHNVKFVACENRGVMGSIFVDVGEKFVIHDKNGEKLNDCIVTAIDPDGVIMIHEETKHECEAGDFVYFTDIKGPEVLNTTDPKQPKLFQVVDWIGPFALRIKVPDGFDKQPEYLNSGGYLHTTKSKVEVSHLPLAEANKANPILFIDDDESKLSAGYELHAVFQAVHQVAKAKSGGENFSSFLKSLNTSEGAQAVDEIMAAAKAIRGELPTDALLRSLIQTFAGNLNPMACFIGGFAAQEVLTVGSGKYTPINQFLYYDAREILEIADVGFAERAPQGTRYDGHVAILGKTLNDKLRNQNVFLVGAGALGCEFAKNIACMGIGTGEKGEFAITDMDTIELSNLSRQFLFRQEHIGSHKSTVAAAAALAMNPQLKTNVKIQKVAPDTETTFTEDFWSSKQLIVNALDNIQARKYVDEKCVYHCLPLFESGTLGSQCNVQTVIPRLTENYNNSFDPSEKTIPLCTLTNTPNAIEHTIAWARNAFNDAFVNGPTEVNSYLHNTESYFAALKKDPSHRQGSFRSVVAGITERPQSPEDCVAWARGRFDEFFTLIIKQLLYTLPVDMVTKDGVPYWGGVKRPPTPLEFDATNPNHIAFVRAAAVLHGDVYGLADGVRKLSDAQLAAITGAIPPAAFVPKQMKIATSDDDKEGNVVIGARELTEADLPPRDETTSKLNLNPIEFEKDDDSNFHIAFIAATANLRAECYKIPPADHMKTKLIAGRIIPAMVTTTALVTGLVGLEIVKYVAGGSKLTHFRNSYANVAIPLMNVSVPIETPKSCSYKTSTGKEVTFSMWDRLDVGDKATDITLKELLGQFKSRYDLDVGMITTTAGKMLYNEMTTKADRLATPVSEIVEKLAGTPFAEDERVIVLIVSATCCDNEVEVPTARYTFSRSK